MPIHKKLPCLLTLVDIFRGWLEAFPTSRETSDGGGSGAPRTQFLGSVCRRPSKQTSPPGLQSSCLHISSSLSWKIHPYFPQPLGKVERPNGVIKEQLTKLALKLRLPQPFFLHSSLTCHIQLKPFELLCWSLSSSAITSQLTSLQPLTPAPPCWPRAYPTSLSYGPFFAHMLIATCLPPCQKTQLFVSPPHPPGGTPPQTVVS